MASLSTVTLNLAAADAKDNDVDTQMLSTSSTGRLPASSMAVTPSLNGSETSTSTNRDVVTSENEQKSLERYETCSVKDVLPERCPSEVECEKLGNECLICNCPVACRYGDLQAIATCSVHPQVSCKGNDSREFERKFTCRYCYQSDAKDHVCKDNFVCDSVAGSENKRYYRTSCRVPDTLLCLGKRDFLKMRKCNWTGGYKWTTALALSITLGGFGADR